jgi:hypothetical protein
MNFGSGTIPIAYSPECVELDFSHLWGEKGRVGVSPIGSKGDEFGAPAPVSATKLAASRNGPPLSNASLARSSGASFRRRVRYASAYDEEAVVVSSKAGDFFRIGVCERPEKSLTDIHGSLGRCVLPGTQMAKVEFYEVG